MLLCNLEVARKTSNASHRKMYGTLQDSWLHKLVLSIWIKTELPKQLRVDGICYCNLPTKRI